MNWLSFQTGQKIKFKKTAGFTLIEILITVAIIGILTAVAVPSYVGMQEKAKKGSVYRAANSHVPELQGWINAVRKGNTSLGTLIEVDTNGNGTIAAPDFNNTTLSTSGIVTTFVASKTDISPWNPAIQLWTNGNAAIGQTACDAVAAGNPGQVTLCFTPAENQTIRFIYISAADSTGSIIYSKTVSAD